jgi:tetratricopeptide (TPR) repeat protein
MIRRLTPDEKNWKTHHQLNAIQMLCEKETLLRERGFLGSARRVFGLANAHIINQWGHRPVPEELLSEPEVAREIYISFLLDEADHHTFAGRLMEAERSYREALQIETDAPASESRDANLVRAMNNYAVLLGDCGRTLEADKCFDAARSFLDEGETNYYIEANLIRRDADLDGPSMEIVDSLKDQADLFRSMGKESNALMMERRRATILYDLGQTNKAWAAFKKVESAMRAKGFFLGLAECHYWRAKARSKAHHPGAETDFVSALNFYRQAGLVLNEAKLYRAYAMHMLENNRPLIALSLIEDAMRMNEVMNLTYMRPSLMADHATILLELGSPAEAEMSWLEALRLLDLLNFYDPASRLQLMMRRVRYLAAEGFQYEATIMLGELREWAISADITPYQKREMDEFDVKQNDARAFSEMLPMIDIQPYYLATRTSIGSVASGYFWLLNQVNGLRRGTLVMEGGGNVEWKPRENILTVSASATNNDLSRHHEFDLALLPATRTPIRVDFSGVSHTPYRMKLYWKLDGATTSSWDIVQNEAEPESISTIRSSLSVANNFFAMPVYHELGKPSNGLVNFRVKSSQPCRVEISDAKKGALLAIDANGSGDFVDRGDILGVDIDENGLPDVISGSAVWIRLYPQMGVDYAEKFDVKTEIVVDGGWLIVGHDRLLGFGSTDELEINH